MLNHIVEDGLATELLNHLDESKPTHILLRRRYASINSQYDALVYKKEGSYRAALPTAKVLEQMKSDLFEVKFVDVDGSGEIEIIDSKSTKKPTSSFKLTGQYLDNTGRQTGIRMKIDKYEISMMNCQTHPVNPDLKILPLTEANNPYHVKKILKLFQDNILQTRPRNISSHALFMREYLPISQI
jgi:hypothetical protein